MKEQDLIEIDAAINEIDTKLSELLHKKNNVQSAIEILEAENIALPEAAYGTLAYYQSEFDKESKAYRQLLGLRNKLKHTNYE